MEDGHIYIGRLFERLRLEAEQELIGLRKAQTQNDEKKQEAAKQQQAILQQKEDVVLQQEEEDVLRAILEAQVTYSAAVYDDEKSEGDLRIALEWRKADEEALTRKALGDIQQYVLKSAVNADGTVTIGARRYKRVECGASHGDQTNLCGYLALTLGNGAEAVTLKQRIAPLATTLSAKIGVRTNFTAADALADVETIRAFVYSEMTPVCVYNATAGVATSYRTDKCIHDCIYLHLSPGHFQRLLAA